MKKLYVFTVMLFLVNINSYSVDNQIIWTVDNLTSIGGYTVTKTGSPTVKTVGSYTAVEFNPTITSDPSSGTGDRIQVKGNPLQGAQSFTIEMIFMPYTSATGLQPRVFHICHPDSASNATRTMTLETRYPTTTTWYGDFFIKSVNSSGFMNTASTYATDQWMHIAMVYDKSTSSMKGYINGQEQISTTGYYSGLPSVAEVSLGGRMQGRYYFKGAIRKLVFTPQALSTSQFTYDGTTGIKQVSYEGYALEQNYPNPVVTNSTIQYTLPKTEQLSLAVYNAMGVKVATLVDETMGEGSHQVSFERGHLPAGIYFYTLTTVSGYRETKKMTIR
mgnify:CR=1 FL=1